MSGSGIPGVRSEAQERRAGEDGDHYKDVIDTKLAIAIGYWVLDHLIKRTSSLPTRKTEKKHVSVGSQFHWSGEAPQGIDSPKSPC